MLRFGNLLKKNSNNNGNLNLEEIFPSSFFFKITPSKKLKKWAGYVDKYLIFPKSLKNYLVKGPNIPNLIHVIDHSNAPYLATINKVLSVKKIITCHDLIAVRSSMGEFKLSSTTSFTGRKLQHLILSSLGLADFFVCDSSQTKSDLNRLVPKSSSCSSIIFPGTEGTLTKDKRYKFTNTLNNQSFDIRKIKYILHVGSSAWYKNRHSILTCLNYLLDNQSLKKIKLILIGPKPSNEEIEPKKLNRIKLNNSLICCENLSESSLSLFYRNALALIFPSHIEGFGWPPLEAAIHGCPVITTKCGAINDLLGKYAKYVCPLDQNSINQAIVDVLNSKEKNSPMTNLPNDYDCRKSYAELYKQLLFKPNHS